MLTRAKVLGLIFGAVLLAVSIGMFALGGDKRISNFLLWQSAYAELFFTDTLWPDFTSSELENMISEYLNTRIRKFGHAV